ncbi:hypothetical protein GUR42_14805, partial [Staphylococcus aureus]|nr:hypothetical protein [Staphylococcus aureus]
SFCKENNISEVVIAGDIMSYHLEEYDILHQRSLFNEAKMLVLTASSFRIVVLI